MPSPKEHRWPCSECGAQLRFAPGQRELTCNHCGHVEVLPDVDVLSRREALREHDLRRGLANSLASSDMEVVRTTRCSSCGALIEFQGATHATECPFCATPVVASTGDTRQIKPQALIPFVYSEKAAREELTKWLGSLWFAPNKLLEYTRKGRAMNGLYVPFWTFDAETRSRYVGQRGDAYYVTREVVINGERQTRQERRIRWTNVQGQVARAFDDVLVLGSLSLPPSFTNDLEPWNLDALVPYRPDYLAGFTAEGYTVPLQAADQQSKSVMARQIERDVRRDIGGDEQRVNGIDTDHSAETFKHILLPIWMAAYKYNGKSYRFLVNGQTGEVQGERPWSIWKIVFAVLAALILAAIIVSVVGASEMDHRGGFGGGFGGERGSQLDWLFDD